MRIGTPRGPSLNRSSDGGRIRSNYRFSKAQEQEMLLDYQKTILNSLKDVSNSLVSYKETRKRREEQAEQVKSAADAVRLARLRYSGGNTSYLEVLTNRHGPLLRATASRSVTRTGSRVSRGGYAGTWRRMAVTPAANDSTSRLNASKHNRGSLFWLSIPKQSAPIVGRIVNDKLGCRKESIVSG